ncbi:MAG: phosphocholine cytidylyltransferase family protein [Pseudomonadota bacterium]
MKAILISAGQGTRLLPLTIHLPKCLVEINGRPILDHQIEALSDAGIEEIFVVGGYRSEQIREHLQTYRPPALTRLLINPFWSVGSSIGSVWAARDQLDTPFCLINGDTVFDATVIRDAWQRAQPGVNLVVEPIKEPQSDDMRVQVKDGRVVAVGKKLPAGETTHRSLGIVLSPDQPGGDYRRALQAVIEEPEGHNAYHHAVIDRLARSVGVTALENRSGLWCEVDRPEDIENWTRDHRPRPWPRILP